jgi:DNA polymerase-3 subunit alpha
VPETERLAWEKDLLGFYVSGHPLAPYEEVLAMYASATTADLAQKADGEEVLVGGILDSVKAAVTRKGRFEGQRWARFELSDLEGATGGVCFAQEYAQYGKHLEANAIVFIRGRVDFQGNEPSLRAQQVIPLHSAHPLLAGGIVFDLDSADADPSLVTQIRDLCASHAGECRTCVRIHTPDDGTYVIEAGRAMHVEPSAQLLDAARQLVGPDRVKYVPRNGNGNGNGRRRRRR